MEKALINPLYGQMAELVNTAAKDLDVSSSSWFLHQIRARRKVNIGPFTRWPETQLHTNECQCYFMLGYEFQSGRYISAEFITCF